MRDEPPAPGHPRTGDPLNLPPPRSSVDGRVRRYDLRTGQLCSDYIGSEWGLRGGPGGAPKAGGAPRDPPNSPCAPRPHHQCVLQQGRAVRAGCQPGLHAAAAGQGHRGAAGRVRPPRPPALSGGLGDPQLIPCVPPRYTGHRSTTYRLDCVLNEQDTHVGCASEDGHVYFWNLVEVREGPGGGIWGHPRLPLTPGVPPGFAGAQPARGPGRGAVAGLPPAPALPAGGHPGPGDAVARGHLPARGGPRHLTGPGGTPVTKNKPRVETLPCFIGSWNK